MVLYTTIGSCLGTLAGDPLSRSSQGSEVFADAPQATPSCLPSAFWAERSDLGRSTERKRLAQTPLRIEKVDPVASHVGFRV